MSDKSKIEWTDATWNPIRGCSRVSEGCRNCYAERTAARFSSAGQPYEGLAQMIPTIKGELRGNPPIAPVVNEPRWTGEVRFIPDLLDQPLRWKKPRLIFVNSMSDLFHEKVTDQWLHNIFAMMTRCTQHTFQVLTKRPERMMDYMHSVFSLEQPKNIWLGVSVEDQKTADARIPLLLQTPAAVRWVSFEPALGPVDFSEWFCCDLPIDWLVAGGESGTHARPSHPDWFRSVRGQCQISLVPFFFKQWGEWIACDQWDSSGDHRFYRGVTIDGAKLVRAGKKISGRLLDGREWNEYPVNL